ncbi:AMP deaminase-like [Trifolium medium]|uniref:AMP deaminase-like n=1 Tax=Trifolium medium TaxID=97028 RepID=A0A392PH29_9FABA|nr:AMP deaminase-like [Trifolium medium]
MAVSAFFIHRRTVDHVLHRIVEIRRVPPALTTDEANSDDKSRVISSLSFNP